MRNVMTADVPWDVKAHHLADPRFPNDPAADQLYTDQKFEAYRALGFSAGTRAVALMRARSPHSRAGATGTARNGREHVLL